MERNGIKVLIVDDEKDARRLISRYLKGNPDIEAVEESPGVEDALFKVVSMSPDLIFLDMMMPGRNGTELMELLKKRGLDCHVVVISGDRDSAIGAIKNNVYDFLLKPVSKEDIKKVIDKFLAKKTVSFDQKLTRVLENLDDGKVIRLSTTTSHVVINPVEIVYCKAEGSYTTIYLEDGRKEMANDNLGMFEKKLPGMPFYRVSRSYLINLHKLAKIDKADRSCILICGKKKIRIQGAKKQLKILSEMDFE